MVQSCARAGSDQVSGSIYSPRRVIRLWNRLPKVGVRERHQEIVYNNVSQLLVRPEVVRLGRGEHCRSLPAGTVCCILHSILQEWEGRWKLVLVEAGGGVLWRSDRETCCRLPTHWLYSSFRAVSSPSVLYSTAVLPHVPFCCLFSLLAFAASCFAAVHRKAHNEQCENILI